MTEERDLEDLCRFETGVGVGNRLTMSGDE
jgi:hypothetical protein